MESKYRWFEPFSHHTDSVVVGGLPTLRFACDFAHVLYDLIWCDAILTLLLVECHDYLQLSDLCASVCRMYSMGNGFGHILYSNSYRIFYKSCYMMMALSFSSNARNIHFTRNFYFTREAKKINKKRIVCRLRSAFQMMCGDFYVEISSRLSKQ